MSPLDELAHVVARLRAPDGCPWDRQQTPQTARRFVLEEAYEVVDAIDEGSDDAVREELGDLLFNIVLLAQMAEERGAFTLHDVARTITDKMIRRHPHVFADASRDASAIATQWERMKAQERAGRTTQRPSALDGVPKAMPALSHAQRLGEKAARIGFDWPDAAGPRAKLDEELGELDEAIAGGTTEAIAHELGDVLFSVVNLARHLRDDEGHALMAEHALRGTSQRFSDRFRRVEDLAHRAGHDIHDADEATLDRWWEQAKRELEGS